MSNYTEDEWEVLKSGVVTAHDGADQIQLYVEISCDESEKAGNTSLVAAAPALYSAAKAIKDCGFDESGASGWGVIRLTHADWKALCAAIEMAEEGK